MGILSDFLYTEKAASAGAGQSAFVRQMAMWLGGGVQRGSGLRLAPVWTGQQNLTFTEASNKGYKAIVWVRACIDLWGKSLGAADWKVYRRGSNKPIPDHPLELLMKRPNPFQDRSEFFQTFHGNLSLSGNDYWEKVVVKDRGFGDTRTATGYKVKHLWHLRPDWVAPIPDPVLFVRGYELNSPFVQGQEIEPARIVHFKYYDPLNPYVGVSPISSAYRSLYAEEGAAEWNQALLDNYAQPSGILSTDATLVPDDRNSLREELLREYTGAERFNPMVLWGGLKWQQLTLNPVDMQFLEQKNQNKEEICAILNTPAILVGAVADPNHSNAGHARLSFWEDRVDPVLTSIQSKLDAELVKPYYGEDLELRYDISNVPAFRKALAEKANIAKVFVGMGFPANDVNDKLRLGLEPTPWGDVAWMPSTVMPVDEDGIERLIAEDPADAATKPKPGTKPSDDEDDGTTEPQRGVDPEDDGDPEDALEK